MAESQTTAAPKTSPPQNLNDSSLTASKIVEEASLASGRCVTIRTQGDKDHLEVIAPNGAVEVTIDLTQQGPMIRLSGAHLQLESLDQLTLKADDVNLLARKAIRMRSEVLDVETSQDLQLYSDNTAKLLSRETYLRAADEICMNAGMIVSQGP
ncbi:hypothetical protein Pan216_27640 [Planctomycetes bacterium Pan216]|uniref:DUF3540 domain-containing protein n=1 Tax=Kolteria novifilia TaxID=2527975 RepID=A0A518B4I4_9BACT|nr:hypothetical protein Pan216_27640 [Planctomycetes bacterium Pan216]